MTLRPANIACREDESHEEGAEESREALMAVDIVQVCAESAANQSSHELAVWLSVLFSIYTVVSIMLSALTIYTSSQIRSFASEAASSSTDVTVLREMSSR